MHCFELNTKQIFFFQHDRFTFIDKNTVFEQLTSKDALQEKKNANNTVYAESITRITSKLTTV